MGQDPAQRPTFLGINSWVNLRTLIGAVSLALGGFASYTSLKDMIIDIRNDQALRFVEIKADISSLRAELNNKTEDRWRKTDMERWMHLLQKANPTLVVPDPQ